MSAPLRDLGQRRRRLAHLADRARRAAHLGAVQGLDRVDHAGVRALGLQRRQHRLQRRLGEHRHRERRLAEPLGPQPHLRRRLLAGYVEDVCAPRPPGWRAPSRSACSCRSPASRRAAPATRERGRRPAPGRARRSRSASRCLGRRLDVAQRRRLRRRRPRAAALRRIGARARLDQRVPLPAAGAATGPGERDLAALLADVSGFGAGHSVNVRSGADGTHPATQFWIFLGALLELTADPSIRTQ